MKEEEKKTGIAQVEQYEGQAQQWAEMFDNQNSRMERLVQEKHVLRIGAMSVEIAPDGVTSINDVLEGFKDLATHLHKLHKDEYLKMSFGRWICGSCLFGMKDAVDAVVVQFEKELSKEADEKGLRLNPKTGRYEAA